MGMAWFKRIINWSVSGFTWFVAPEKALALALAAGATVTAILWKVPLWAWPLVLALTFGAVLWAINGYFHFREFRRGRKSGSIPIAFNDLSQGGVLMYAFTGTPDPAKKQIDAIAFQFSEVTIANISASRPVVLSLYLHLTGEGWNVMLPCTPKIGLLGDLGENGPAAILLRSRGLPVPSYFENPIKIAAGEAVTGQPVFLHLPFDDESRVRITRELVGTSKDMSLQLVAHDMISGVELRWSPPVSYRGKGD